VLNTLYLIQEALLSLPILYLSRYIIALRADYYRLLLDVTRKQIAAVMVVARRERISARQ
jgi:Fic family protein